MGNEYLNKIRKPKVIRNCKPKSKDTGKSNEINLLQEEMVSDNEENMTAQHDDGIKTGVEFEGDLDDDQDLLDYDDDLSVDEDELEVAVQGGNNKSSVPEKVKSKEKQKEYGTAGTSAMPTSSMQLAALDNQTDDQLKMNTVLQNMMKAFFQEQLKNMQAGNPGLAGKGDMSHHGDINIRSKEMEVSKEGCRTKSPAIQGNQTLIKSPSDTTLYTPALKKKLTPTGVVGRNINGATGDSDCDMRITGVTDVAQISGTNADLINNFVEAVRIQQHPDDEVIRRRSDVAAVEMQEAQRRAEHGILEAEKFTATVEQPGNPSKFLLPQPLSLAHDRPNGPIARMNVGVGTDNAARIFDIGSGVSDDDFFHLTCHIEPSLIHKIEKGEFVELEKLLPKDKFGKIEEGRMEWVHRDGGTFLVPVQRDGKISGFRRWEQAFRAYATIYCGANPHRSKEIWQYITVINTAASSYAWDNVYNYDITFRHLMAFNPHRSWAVTYNQMWNLSMRDPIPKKQIWFCAAQWR